MEMFSLFFYMFSGIGFGLLVSLVLPAIFIFKKIDK